MSHRLKCLSTYSPFDGTIWVSLGSAALLGSYITQDGFWGAKPPTIPRTLSLLGAWGSSCKFSATQADMTTHSHFPTVMVMNPFRSGTISTNNPFLLYFALVMVFYHSSGKWLTQWSMSRKLYHYSSFLQKISKQTQMITYKAFSLDISENVWEAGFCHITFCFSSFSFLHPLSFFIGSI